MKGFSNIASRSFKTRDALFSRFASTGSSATKSVLCPACNTKSIEIKGDMFCCSICPNRQEVNYFKLLGLPEKYSVDLSEADSQFRKLQMSLHPDKLNDDLAASIPEGYSSLLNRAIAVVKSPLKRAMHLLYLMDGCTIQESELTNDRSLLMEMMELNEEVEDCGPNKECLENLKNGNQSKLFACDEELAALFCKDEFSRARTVCERMHYLDRIGHTIDEKLNSSSS